MRGEIDWFEKIYSSSWVEIYSYTNNARCEGIHVVNPQTKVHYLVETITLWLPFQAVNNTNLTSTSLLRCDSISVGQRMLVCLIWSSDFSADVFWNFSASSMPGKYRKYRINLSENVCGSCLDIYLDVCEMTELWVEYFCTQ